MVIKINKKGRIVSPNDEIHYVFIEDQLKETGGYLIFKAFDFDFIHAYDDWVIEDKLNQYFAETGWQIEWLE